MIFLHTKNKNNGSKQGFILVNALVFGAIAIVITSALVGWASTVIRSARQLTAREQAFQIAEAGIDYYRWHLAHAQSDFTDATTTPGPYIHPFYNKDGDQIGQFALTITPPPTGSTVVKIVSKGTVVSDPVVARTLQATLAIPSLAKFAVVANDVMRFGAGTEVFGPIHSNNGIHFDGLAHNIITSAKDKYIDPDYSGPYRFGVYTRVSPIDPTPPAAVPSRPDVFMAGRQFPLPSVDFTGITTNLSAIKAAAQSGGKYLAASGAQGYRILFKTNDTYDVYRVNSLFSPSGSCSNTQNQSGWGSWSIGTNGGAQTLIGNYPNPANGLIFVEDHVWVEGQINGARITVAAGTFPDNSATRRSITVNNNLLYTDYTGLDVIALIAQGDVNVGLRSLDTLRIDAALVAQNGRVGRFYYPDVSGCNNYDTRDELTLYGMIASNIRYGFAYTDGTGYNLRNIIYDSNLLYAPPPSFPLTSDQYTVISWQEI